MAVMRTDRGKTFNLRGLKRDAGTAKYEFAYEVGGVGSNRAGEPKIVANRMGAKAQRTVARLRGQ